jgi:hypothetical protein
MKTKTKIKKALEIARLRGELRSSEDDTSFYFEHFFTGWTCRISDHPKPRGCRSAIERDCINQYICILDADTRLDYETDTKRSYYPCAIIDSSLSIKEVAKQIRAKICAFLKAENKRMAQAVHVETDCKTRREIAAAWGVHLDS